MNILVCIKQVPETREVEVDEKTGVLKRDGVDSVINPYDLYALEHAIRLKERYGGLVTVISMGPPQASIIIREAFMMGADNGFLLSDINFAGADTLATAYTLACGISKIGSFDLIICGMQTTDGDTAQVGPGIAEFLSIPHEAYVEKISEVKDNSVIIDKDMGTYTETVEIKFPCLLTVNKTLEQPRLLSYRRKLLSKDWPIIVWGFDDIKVDYNNYFGLDGSPTQVDRIFPPEANTDHTKWYGSSEEVSEKMFTKLEELKFL